MQRYIKKIGYNQDLLHLMLITLIRKITYEKKIFIQNFISCHLINNLHYSKCQS
jgi:hypothetical protein